MRKATRRGFTLIELMIVMSIIALLGMIVLPTMVKARQMASLTVCISNLKNISSAIEGFSSDHGGAYPDPTSSSDIEMLAEEYIGRVLTCPIFKDFYIYNLDNSNYYILVCPSGSSLGSSTRLYADPTLTQEIGTLKLDASSGVAVRASTWSLGTSTVRVAHMVGLIEVVPVFTSEVAAAYAPR